MYDFVVSRLVSRPPQHTHTQQARSVNKTPVVRAPSANRKKPFRTECLTLARSANYYTHTLLRPNSNEIGLYVYTNTHTHLLSDT